MTDREWVVLRACWRLGPNATTGDVVRAVQRDVLLDYKHIRTLLGQLAAKGALEVDTQQIRRYLWSAVAPPQTTLHQFLEQVIGRDFYLIAHFRKALDDLEASGPIVAFSSSELPKRLRERLVDFLAGFLRSQRNRLAVAALLSLDPEVLQGRSPLAASSLLMSFPGEDVASSALRVLDAIESLLADEDADDAAEIASLRPELEAHLSARGR